MKRDMELVRKILLKIEDEYQFENVENMPIDGYSFEVVCYHCEIMYDIGLLKYFEIHNYISGESNYDVGGLSWEGQDYLEQIRNDEIWEKTMKEIEDKKLPKDLNTIASVAGNFIGGIIGGMN